MADRGGAGGFEPARTTQATVGLSSAGRWPAVRSGI